MKNEESRLLQNELSQGFFEQQIEGLAALGQAFWINKNDGSGTFAPVSKGIKWEV